MYRLMIADDEQSIRNGLKLLIDWESLGFTICGEAGDGDTALGLIRSQKPDAVIIDIKMPGLSGLSVIEEARKSGLHTRFVILSGYSDFKYAQDAVKLGVLRYLTKPVDEDELASIMREISDELAAEALESSKNSYLSKKTGREIVLGILDGEIDPNSPWLSSTGLVSDAYRLVGYENFDIAESTLPYGFSELFRAAGNVAGDSAPLSVHFEHEGKNYLLLLSNAGLSRFDRFLTHYKSNIQEKSPLGSLFLTYSDRFDSLTDLKKAFYQTSVLLKRRFFCVKEQHILDYDYFPKIKELPETNSIDHAQVAEFGRNIADNIQIFNRRQTAELLHNLEVYFLDGNMSDKCIRLFMIDLFSCVRDHILKSYPEKQLPFLKSSTLIDKVRSCNYLYEINMLFTEQFEAIMTALGNSSADSIIDDVISYVGRNYHNVDLRLETVSSLFGYNPSYLGKLFTKATGMHFGNYVDQVRIEQAKKLLCECEYKVYEISDKVGYRNVDYFHKKFRKLTGESPADYRKKACKA